jgi:hypothetical protein
LLKAARATGAEFVADNQFCYDGTTKQVSRIPQLGNWEQKTINAYDFFRSEIMGESDFAYGDLKPLILKSVFSDSNIWYNEDVRLGEDTILYAEMLLSGIKSHIVNRPMYYYTSRIGDFSGKTSPTSRSDSKFEALIKASREIEIKYINSIDIKLLNLMHRRLVQIEMLSLYNNIREYRRAGRYAKYIKEMVSHPQIAKFVVSNIFKRMVSKPAKQARALGAVDVHGVCKYPPTKPGDNY